MKKTGSMMTVLMELRVKIIYTPNSSWCKLPEFISYKKCWMMKVPAFQELLLNIIKKTGSMKILCMELRVQIVYLIVVGANCLSSYLIKSSEWWRCQLSRTITQDYEELFLKIMKHEDIMYGNNNLDHPLNSSWCKLPEFISYKELWTMKVPAVKNYYSR